jgi:hypothetical protein
MKRLLITALLLFVTAAPALALPYTFEFTFSGAAFNPTVDPGPLKTVNDAVAKGYISIESSAIVNPGYKEFDRGNDTFGAILDLYVTVTNTTNGLGNGTFTLANFTKVIFDTGSFSLTPLDLTKPLFDQVVYNDGSKEYTWGQYVGVDGSDPPRSFTGDFEIFASDGTLLPYSTGPTGSSPFVLATNNGVLGPNNEFPDGIQLTSFSMVPEPSTFTLLCLSLGVVGFARKRMPKLFGCRTGPAA